MRLVCQKCSATYAIDDKLITLKGIRAQCPKCRHLQFVKREAAVEAGPDIPAASELPTRPNLRNAPAPPLPAPGQVPVPPLAPLPPAPSGGAFLFDLPGSGHDLLAPAAEPLPAPPAEAFSFDFGGPPLPPGLGPPPPGPAAPAPFLPELGPPSEVSGSAPAAEPARQELEVSQWGSSASGAFPGEVGRAMADVKPPQPAKAPLKCRRCGKALVDAFDQALGTCDECRSRQQGGQSETSAPDREAPPASAPRSPAKGVVSPAPPVFEPPISAPRPARTAARYAAAPGGRRGWLLGGSLVVVALAVGGGWYLLRKPSPRRTPVRLARPAAETPAALEALVKQWRVRHGTRGGSAAGTASEHLRAGDEHLRRDTTQGYLDAIDEFQKALIVDSANVRALAGWALAVALSDSTRADPAATEAAEGLLSTAERYSDEPRLFVAHAHVLLARGGNPSEISAMSERGKVSVEPFEKALAHLAIGQLLVGKNPTGAAQEIEQAAAVDPTLKRNRIVQAQLAVSQGRYRAAIEHLEKRLAADGDQWEASLALARLWVEVGEPLRAKEVLQAAHTSAPQSVRARLLLGALSYQHLGDPAVAIEQLSAVAGDDRASKEEAAEAWVHLSAIHRAAAQPDKAEDALLRAEGAAPDSIPARLQRTLVLLDKGAGAEAQKEIEALKGKLGDPALEAMLRGRLHFVERRYSEAATVLEAAADADPRRVEGFLLAGAAAAKAKQESRAWELCLKKAVRADPFTSPTPVLTPLYVRPRDFLKTAQGAYTSLSAGADEDPNPVLCEALVAYFSEEPRAAEGHFSKVSAIDVKNAEAYAYRALLALKKRDLPRALALAERGVDASRSSALAHYAGALAQLALGKPDQAKAAAQMATRFGPQLIGPRVLIAEIEARESNSVVARTLLTGVLLADPLYREAKRVLYKQSL